jgi:hypothetical protein
MSLRRSLLRIAPAASIIVALTPLAARADIVPAPPAQASAVAAQVGSLLDVSRTGATAGPDASGSQASVLRLAGEPVLGLGASQTGDGQTGGALVDTGAALPARVQVGPWQASADGTHTSTRHARGSAAVARAEAPAIARAGLLTSQSEASSTDQHSTGTAVSDGADADLIDALRLVLLHSEVTSDGEGHSYLVSVNGTEIGTDDQLGDSPLCALNAASLADLSCLTASGGAAASGGGIGGAAQVIGIDPALDALATVDPIAAFATTSSSGTAQGGSAPLPAPAEAGGTDTSRAVAPIAAAADASPSSGTLPRTGTGAAALAGLAVALSVFGLGLRRLAVVRAGR